VEHKIARRAAIIMLAFTAAEATGLILMLSPVPWPRILALFTYHQAAWPAWIAAAAIAAAYVSASAWSLTTIATRFWDVTALKFLAIPFALATGAFEEIVFRRMLMNLAAGPLHQGSVVQLIVSATVFGAVHAVWGAFARSWNAVVVPMLWTSALGLGLALTYLLAGRDVAPCIWSHIAINLCIEPWLLIGVMRRSAEARSEVVARGKIV
jgi:hypothetical protein